MEMRKSTGTVRTIKRELGNVLEVVRASKENVRPSRMILNTWEDVQAVLSSTSGVVAGLKWKKAIQKMMNHVLKNDKVLSVCPIRDCEMGAEMLLMVTDSKIIISDGKFVLPLWYGDVSYLGKKQGVVSDYIVMETDDYLIEFTWDSKKGDLKLVYHTRKILFNKVRRTTTTRQLEVF